MTGRGFYRPRLVSGARERHEGPVQVEIHANQFRLVMLPHMDAAYSFARYLTRDGVLAEDVVQEAFLHALRGIARWHGDNPRAWLLAIVRRCYLDAVAGRRDPLRGAAPVEAIDTLATSPSGVEAGEDQAARQCDAATLRRTIEDLPEPFRETVVLRELEELSYKEIAAITEVPIGTVMSRLARARNMLAALLLPTADQTRGARS
jgi:RNA polymerase sigma-70 factor (ECF subfamily)